VCSCGISVSKCNIWYRHYILSFSRRFWLPGAPESRWRRVSLSQQLRNFTNLNASFSSILKTSSYTLEYSCILFGYFGCVEEQLNILWEYLRSTSFCIQLVQELLGAIERIGVPDQNSCVVELWLPDHFTFCCCQCTCKCSLKVRFWILLWIVILHLAGRRFDVDDDEVKLEPVARSIWEWI